MKNIAVLGSTGSIGVQTLDVIKSNQSLFNVEVITANNNYNLLIQQAKEFLPKVVVISNHQFKNIVKTELSSLPIKVYGGEEALTDVVQIDSLDLVLVALVGYSGLNPTVNAIKAKKDIAIANKESLVVAGELITELATDHNVNIYPVDSEHSAIFQCLAGESRETIEKIILTASGGPFRGKSISDLSSVSVEQALNHPNWSMGTKITIDSASLMNKGFEVIETRWLFDVEVEKIDVVIHPQSIIHSMVQFDDGSIKAQMGLPDMKLPIQYALAYPKRIKSNFPRLDFFDNHTLTFEKPDLETFPNLRLAYDSIKKGGNLPCVVNAANEVAVDAFLNSRIGFLQMTDVIEKCMNIVSFVEKPTLEDYTKTNIETKNKALEIINN